MPIKISELPEASFLGNGAVENSTILINYSDDYVSPQTTRVATLKELGNALASEFGFLMDTSAGIQKKEVVTNGLNVQYSDTDVNIASGGYSDNDVLNVLVQNHVVFYEFAGNDLYTKNSLGNVVPINNVAYFAEGSQHGGNELFIYDKTGHTLPIYADNPSNSYVLKYNEYENGFDGSLSTSNVDYFNVMENIFQEDVKPAPIT